MTRAAIALLLCACRTSVIGPACPVCGARASSFAVIPAGEPDYVTDSGFVTDPVTGERHWRAFIPAYRYTIATTRHNCPHGHRWYTPEPPVRVACQFSRRDRR